MKNGALVMAFLGVIAFVSAAGCASVEPWERQRLSHDCMQVPVDEDDATGRAKMEAAREGSAGGVMRGGGGCGCD